MNKYSIKVFDDKGYILAYVEEAKSSLQAVQNFVKDDISIHVNGRNDFNIEIEILDENKN